MKCDICDEEFDTENQLMQHKAQMHAGQTGKGEEPGEDMVDAREGMMPKPDDELEEPDFPKAANE
jgi:hypothetical protein